jgi:peroxin-5
LEEFKFFQFASKMSRGDLIIEDNGVKQGSASQSYNANATNSWAGQFVHEEVIPESWMHVNNCMAC